MADAISIEATNKIRKSLGLPLLPVPGRAAAAASASGPVFKQGSDDSDTDDENDKGSTLESRQAQGYDNYKQIEAERQRRAAKDIRKAAIRKAQEAAARNARLQGIGLGEAEDGQEQGQDTRAWLMSQNKRQRKIEKEREKARRLEDELKAREDVSYTSKDLTGIRVAHELGDFDAEEEQVLILKDAAVDDDDDDEEAGDELENIGLKEKESRDERLRLKKKKPAYDPNEDDGGDGKVLKQYDEVIDGKKRKRFTLDADGQTKEQKEASKSTLGDQVNRQAFSLDILKDAPQSDYAEVKELKIRKPKKRKTKATRERASLDEDIFGGEDATMDNVGPNSNDKSTNLQRAPVTADLIDDDDLQVSLAKQRREALKKRKKLRPEDLARQLRDETENAMQEDEAEDDDSGLMIDGTSMFVSNFEEKQREIEEQQRERDERHQPPQDIATKVAIKPEDGDDIEMVDDLTGPPSAVKAEEEEEHDNEGDNLGSGIGAEQDFSKGLGGVLDFIRGRGVWEANSGTTANQDTRNAQTFRLEKRRLESDAEARARAQRLAGRETGRYAGHSQREREEMHRKENEHRQQQDSRELARLYSETYQPSFQLTYKDEHGRNMTQKEAFKHLSHQFHGKGSGKMKTEKQLKKIELERKNESKSLVDNSQMSNYSNAADAAAKRRGTVGVHLGK